MSFSLIRSQQLYAWKGPSLLIVDSRGECSDREQLSGYYFRETRFLKTLRLEVNGHEPWLCEPAALQPDALAFTYVHPEAVDDAAVPHRALSLRLLYTVKIDGLTVTLTISNHATRRVEADVAWQVDADFADIQEANDGKRQQDAAIHRQIDGEQVRFNYQHPQLRYRSAITARGSTPWELTESTLKTRLSLEAQQAIVLTLDVAPTNSEGATAFEDVDLREQHLRNWQQGLTPVTIAGNRLAERVLSTNVRDFASFPLVEGPRDEWLTLQAGMPLYPALFGRDSLTAGWQGAYLDRGESLDASLTRLGRMQSDRVDDFRDAEPGRIPYQVRRGPLALLNLNPYSAYYADFASPFMFVIALAHLYSWTGDRQSIERHWDVARRILEWARTYGDRDGDGYLEYQTRSSKGTKNQGWKDSGDAIVYDDGREVPSPIATCEIQGYWFAAQQLMAFLSAALGQFGDAKNFWQSAADLKERFNRDWWDEDEGSIVLALDPDKRQVRAVTSNVGHCIATGIISDEHLPRVVDRMFAPDMFSGWGIRTLSSNHRAFNPLSYHLGTVWAVEQSTIAFGLRRFGFDSQSVELAAALFDLALWYPDCRIPECIGGYARSEANAPGAFPRANTPQLWNASGFPLLIHSILGFQPVAPLATLVVDPVLPIWLPEVVVHDLRLADAVATLRFWRDDSGVSHVETLQKRGTLRVVKQPPPESLTAGLRDRMSALFDTVRH